MLIGPADLIGWPEHDSMGVLRERLQKALNIPRGDILLVASHTHGGPRLPNREIAFRHFRFKDASLRYFGVPGTPYSYLPPPCI